MGVRNTKPQDSHRNGGINQKSGYIAGDNNYPARGVNSNSDSMNQKSSTTGGGGDSEGAGISNIPGPKAPPKFSSIFLTESSPDQLPFAISNAPTTARPKTIAPRSRSLAPYQVTSPKNSTSSNQPITTMTSTAPTRMSSRIDEEFKESDVNLLPRQSTVDDFISAIDDVTKRSDLVLDRTNSDNDKESIISDPDIDYLVKEVERREKRQKELDYKIKVNERRLSEKYRKMARDNSLNKYRPSSLDRSQPQLKQQQQQQKQIPNEKNEPASSSKRKSVTIVEEEASLASSSLVSASMDEANKRIEENKLKRETLIRKLANFEDLESKKKQRLSEQEKELSIPEATRQIAESAQGLPNDDQSPKRSVVVKRQAPMFRHYSAEPKRETLVIPMTLKDERKGIDESELKKIISVIENIEKQCPSRENMPSRYFINGQEIYSKVSVPTSPEPEPKRQQQEQPKTSANSSQPPANMITTNKETTNMMPSRTARSSNKTRTICVDVPYDDNSTVIRLPQKSMLPPPPPPASATITYQGRPIIYTTTYDRSEAAKKLAQIDYLLAVADRSVKTTTMSDRLNYKSGGGADDSCGYRMLDKKAELKKVDWDIEMLNLDAAIASRLRRKHTLVRSRAADARPKSEFAPNPNKLDRSMSPSVASSKSRSTSRSPARSLDKKSDDMSAAIRRSLAKSRPSSPSKTSLAMKRAMDERRRQVERSSDAADGRGEPSSNRPSTPPSKTSMAIMRAIDGRRFDDDPADGRPREANGKQKPPPPYSSNNRPPRAPPRDQPTRRTGKQLSDELNLAPPPEPFERPPSGAASQRTLPNRRGSDASIGSRISRRLKFWDRRTADQTASSVLARVKPVGA